MSQRTWLSDKLCVEQRVAVIRLFSMYEGNLYEVKRHFVKMFQGHTVTKIGVKKINDCFPNFAFMLISAYSFIGNKPFAKLMLSLRN